MATKPATVYSTNPKMDQSGITAKQPRTDWMSGEKLPPSTVTGGMLYGDVATRTIDGLLDVIEDMVRQFAAERDDGQIDSSALGALADAMHVLHTAERLQITYAKGRRVIGKWASNVK